MGAGVYISSIISMFQLAVLSLPVLVILCPPLPSPSPCLLNNLFFNGLHFRVVFFSISVRLTGAKTLRSAALVRQRHPNPRDA